ncbi:hypothetical protein NEOLEDRAFT_1183530 [Neolentinus lepideus HHB14362 ss-1]|uniref:Tim17-domain-containing protein n=1 Tax=Neolentinus lepideus HHB14362 ss-1 TaxID=1314782 RepID=A0A165N7W0_9AGAM|nr:hypothetical protein NEOLEDRAFT_1183530 [Neolentinus lepideus HHB14362 ss-1]
MGSDVTIVGDEQPGVEPLRINVNIPPKLYTVPFVSFVLGTMIGVQRGSRMASMRFLAENVHRPPRTVRGWYFYHKTKNYKVLWGALKEGGRVGSRLGLITLGWMGTEEGLRRAGGLAEEGREVGAALVTAAGFCGVYRVTGMDAGRIMGLGLAGGIAMWALRVLQAAKSEGGDVEGSDEGGDEGV